MMNINPNLIKNSFLDINENLIKQAKESSAQNQKIFENILNHGKIPPDGLDIHSIQFIIHSLSSLDSNNFNKKACVGEREGRIFSSIVKNRSFGFAHGVGRSGDLCEVQPKAIGSSILYQITNKLTYDALNLSNMTKIKKCVVIPLATGMTLTLCMRALSKNRLNSMYVIWPRIDQKSCFKSIISAGFIPIIIQNIPDGDSLKTNISSIEEAIKNHGAESIVCIMTTSSCFAPRIPDDIIKTGDLCQLYNIPHLLNNAYGVQVKKYSDIINETIVKTRLDLIVQSTDKNFMVPVGGAVVASADPNLIDDVTSSYSGRASIYSIQDLFITFLEMGSNTYLKLLKEREKSFIELNQRLSEVAKEFNLKLLSTPKNKISLALSLENLKIDQKTIVGRKLFFKSVSGARIIQHGETKNINGYIFKNWGTHSDESNLDYLACAASIGMNHEDIDRFTKRLKETLSEYV